MAAIAAVTILYIRTASQVEQVSLEAEAVMTESTVRISGTTNLSPGAILGYAILAETGETIGSGFYELTDSEIQLLHSLALGDKIPSKAVLTFEVFMEDRAQPPALIEQFGAAGQRMAADRVENGEYGRRLIWQIDIGE